MQKANGIPELPLTPFCTVASCQLPLHSLFAPRFLWFSHLILCIFYVTSWATKKRIIKNTKKCILIKCHTNATRNVRTVWYFIARLWRVWNPTESPLREGPKNAYSNGKNQDQDLHSVTCANICIFIFIYSYRWSQTSNSIFLVQFEWKN